MAKWIIPIGDETKAIRFTSIGSPIVGIPQRYAVRDTFGDWICSRHKSFDLAQKRADDCNRRALINGDRAADVIRYKVEPYNV